MEEREAPASSRGHSPRARRDSGLDRVAEEALDLLRDEEDAALLMKTSGRRDQRPPSTEKRRSKTPPRARSATPPKPSTRGLFSDEKNEKSKKAKDKKERKRSRSSSRGRRSKRSRSRSRRRRSSSSVSSLDYADSPFGDGSSSKIGTLTNKIRRLAKKHPGRLLRAGLGNMENYLGPLYPSGGDPRTVTKSGTQAVCTAYYLAVRNSFKATQSLRNDKEMRTLALAIDALVRGQSLVAGDVLIQRFKAVEAASHDGHWRVASHLEIVPADTVSSVSAAEREAASSLELREASLRDRLNANDRAKRGRSGSRD